MTTHRPSARPWVPIDPTAARIRAGLQDCRGCELYHDAVQAVPGDGPVPAELMLIGEQPGDREDRAGAPFVGPAGHLLDEAMRAAGLDPATSFRTNAVKHFRFRQRGKRRIHQAPTHAQVVACTPWLEAELEVVRPVGVVLLGATAGTAVYGSSFRVGEHRGKFLDWPADLGGTHRPAWTLATTHPSAVLRARDRDAAFGDLVADLRRLTSRPRRP